MNDIYGEGFQFSSLLILGWTGIAVGCRGSWTPLTGSPVPLSTELPSTPTIHWNFRALRAAGWSRGLGLGQPRLRGLPARRAAGAPRSVHLRRALRQDWHVERRIPEAHRRTTGSSHRGCAPSAPGSPTPGPGPNPCPGAGKGLPGGGGGCALRTLPCALPPPSGRAWWPLHGGPGPGSLAGAPSQLPVVRRELALPLPLGRRGRLLRPVRL